MGDPSEKIELMEEENQEHQWTQQKEGNSGHIEDSFEDKSHQLEEYSTTRALKRKAKKKDEGPLEIFCGMIVEHQIGMLSTILPSEDTH